MRADLNARPALIRSVAYFETFTSTPPLGN